MQESKYRLAIFDLDGTLMDTSIGIIKAIKKTIHEFGLQELNDSQLKSFIGPPLQKSFSEIYGISKDRTQKIVDIFRNYYMNEFLFKASPYEGIFDTLDAMCKNGMKIAVATYKRHDCAKRLLEHYHFDDYAKVIYGSDPFGVLKKSDIIQKCINSSDERDINKVIMIGDGKGDADGAAAFGMPFLGVTYGFGFQKEEEVYSLGGIGCAKSPIDILKFVCE